MFGNVVASAFDSAAAAASTADEKELVLFRKRVDETPGRRTDWEDTATTLLARHGIGTDIHRPLMYMANEAYQYSWRARG